MKLISIFAYGLLVSVVGCGSAPTSSSSEIQSSGVSVAATTSSTIASSIYCQSDGSTSNTYTDVSNDTLYSLNGCVFIYSEDTYLDGNVIASAGVACGGWESSFSEVYANTQVGVATAPISVVYDVAPPSDDGFWTLSLNRTTHIVSAKYTDSDVSGSPKTWTFPKTGCVAHTY